MEEPRQKTPLFPRTDALIAFLQRDGVYGLEDADDDVLSSLFNNEGKKRQREEEIKQDLSFDIMLNSNQEQIKAKRDAEEGQAKRLKEMEEQKEAVQDIVSCSICFCVPAPDVRILKCSNDHVLCKECYDMMPTKNCGLCRVKMDKPATHRIAESLRDVLLSGVDKSIESSRTTEAKCVHCFAPNASVDHQSRCWFRFRKSVALLLKKMSIDESGIRQLPHTEDLGTVDKNKNMIEFGPFQGSAGQGVLMVKACRQEHADTCVWNFFVFCIGVPVSPIVSLQVAYNSPVPSSRIVLDNKSTRKLDCRRASQSYQGPVALANTEEAIHALHYSAPHLSCQVSKTLGMCSFTLEVSPVCPVNRKPIEVM